MAEQDGWTCCEKALAAIALVLLLVVIGLAVILMCRDREPVVVSREFPTQPLTKTPSATPTLTPTFTPSPTPTLTPTSIYCFPDP